MTLSITKLSAWHRAGLPVLQDVTLEVEPGRITAILGPNGAGKSTLLKAVAGLVRSRGDVRLHGEDLTRLSYQARAQRLAYVPQRSRLEAPLDVRTVVEQGRFAHSKTFHRRSRADGVAVTDALRAVNAEALAARPFPELSCGEQQRVLLARALATGARALLLDEPTSSLDIGQALGLHRTIRGLADQGTTIVVVLHDLNEARVHADRAILLDQGRIVDSGRSADIVVGTTLRSVYGVEAGEANALTFKLIEERG